MTRPQPTRHTDPAITLNGVSQVLPRAGGAAILSFRDPDLRS
jgi:hypothetical protein